MKPALSEVHHAHVLMAFHQLLLEQAGERRGREIFMAATQAYGARRGRRMALRALRDGNPLDMASYFAYGELLSTPGAYVGTYTAVAGQVHEQQVQCPWAQVFHQQGGQACGVDYCKEIDLAIICGFNPNLDFLCTQNMHTAPSCDFFYGGPEIQADFLETFPQRLPQGAQVKRDMTFHTADVYDSFCRTVGQVLPQAGDLIDRVRETLKARFGPEFLDLLDSFPPESFEAIEP